MRHTLLALLLVVSGCALEVDDGVIWVPEDLTIDDRAEGDTGLFMGLALTEPVERVLTHREYWTTKIEFRQQAEDFIPATLDRLTLDTPIGEIAVIEVDRAQGRDDAPLFVHCYGIGANLYNNGIQYALKVLPFGDSIHFDLPGHGESGGEPTVANIQIAVDAVLAHVEEVRADRQVVFWGHSMGGFVCSEMAQRAGRVDALVLEAVGRDAPTVARTWIPLVMRPFVRMKAAGDIADFNIADILQDFDKPVLMFGGGRDDIIPARLVSQLADELIVNGLNIDYYEFPDADHSTIAFADEFQSTVWAFLNSL